MYYVMSTGHAVRKGNRKEMRPNWCCPLLLPAGWSTRGGKERMVKKRARKWNMLEDSPGITLFLFALPMILGNLFQQFYNMVIP